MPSEPRRLHGFTVVSRALRLGRQLLLPAIVGGASAGASIEGTLRWILLILSVPSIVVAVAQWLAFRFRIDDDDLVIDSGVLARRRRVIPLARIQNIDLEQSLIERLARVAEVRLETASGGSETEASLAVLGVDEARDLQAELMRRRIRVRPPEAAADEGDAVDAAEGVGVEPSATAGEAPGRVLLRLGTADLALAGATSNEAGLIAAGLATLLEFSGDFAQAAWLERTIVEVFGRGADMGFTGAVLAGAVVAAGFVFFGWVLSIVATIVRFHGFTLTRVGDDLRREYGLFSRHRSTIALERVQAVRIEETLLRRPLGLAALKIETAGSRPGREDQPGGRAEAFVPLARRREVGPLIAEVFEDAALEGVPFQGVAPISRRRTLVRLAVPIIAAAGVLGATVSRQALAILLLLVPAWFFARAQYRARAWARTPGYALARGGVFTRTTWVVPDRKVQTLHTRESLFQRRWDLATIVIDTAAGGRVARVVDVRRDTAETLVAELAADAVAARRAAPGAPRAGTGP